jgi:outer membrane protein assembly factor BamB
MNTHSVHPARPAARRAPRPAGRACPCGIPLALLIAAMLAHAAWASDRGGPARTGEFPGAAVRTAPKVAWAASLGFRDWGQAVRAGGLVIATNCTGIGGLYAVDERSGTMRWKVGRAQALAAPVSDGKLVVAAYHTVPKALAAYAVADGRPLWRVAFEHVQDAQPALMNGVLYATHRNGNFYAYDAATGAERWHFNYGGTLGHCASQPVVADGVVYFTGGGYAEHDKAKGYHLWALDATTGRELWRYQAQAKYEWSGVCIRQILLAGDTLVVSGFFNLYGVDRASGRERWATEVPDGSKRAEVHGMVYTGGTLYGVTEHFLGAFDPASGRTLWQLPGSYRVVTPATAVVGNVLYFQGRVRGVDDAEPAGVMHALDLRTRELLWSFSDNSAGPWHFGDALPADAALYVQTANKLLKLHAPP